MHVKVVVLLPKDFKFFTLCFGLLPGSTSPPPPNLKLTEERTHSL